METSEGGGEVQRGSWVKAKEVAVIPECSTVSSAAAQIIYVVSPQHGAQG